jgi:hypothetical protein
MDEMCNKIREETKEANLKAFIDSSAIKIWGEDMKECETRLSRWERVGKECELQINLEKAIMLKLKRSGDNNTQVKMN